MEQKLSRYQNLIVLTITFLLHAGILLSIIIIKFEHSPTEAKVLLAQDESIAPQTPQKDWVTTSASMPVPSQPKAAPPATSPPNQTTEQPISETAPSLNDKQIEHAVSLAQKLLNRVENRETEQKDANASPPQEQPKKQPPITLAQIAQGFMQQMQESPMNVRSNRQGQASMEQLQQMNYMQKIIACIVNSYKIHNNSTLRGYTMQQARIHLALNKDGSIHTLQLVQSSGNITIDQFLISMFQDASSSFPPLPSSFKEQTFQLPLFNVDRLESFQSVNGWYIDNTMR